MYNISIFAHIATSDSTIASTQTITRPTFLAEVAVVIKLPEVDHT